LEWGGLGGRGGGDGDGEGGWGGGERGGGAREERGDAVFGLLCLFDLFFLLCGVEGDVGVAGVDGRWWAEAAARLGRAVGCGRGVRVAAESGGNCIIHGARV
jgi:hypothetical protein